MSFLGKMLLKSRKCAEKRDLYYPNSQVASEKWHQMQLDQIQGKTGTSNSIKPASPKGKQTPAAPWDVPFKEIWVQSAQKAGWKRKGEIPDPFQWFLCLCSASED